MRSQCDHLIRGATLPTLLLWSAITLGADADTACAPGTRYASELVDASLLNGPTHSVAPCTQIVGHMARFVLHTDYGDLSVDSVGLLALRIEEMPAMARAMAVTDTALFAEAAKQAGMGTGTAIGKIVLNPIDTIAGIPTRALRFFDAQYARLRQRALDLSDRTADAAMQGGDPYDDATQRPGVVPEAGTPRRWYQRGYRRARGFALSYVGYGKTRRQWAQRLGVDPYTTNALLAAHLDELGWAAWGGNKAFSMALGAVSGGAGSALSATRKLNRIVWELPPDQVRARNEERLAAFGCEGTEARRFLRNGRFTPTLQTAFVDALIDLRPANDCWQVVELAAALETEIEARYLIDALRLLLQDRNDAAEHPQLSLIGTGIVAKGNDASIVLPLPVDRLTWTRATRNYFDLPAFRVRDKTALIGGLASPTAMRGLTRRGWSIVLRAPFEGAPPYVNPPD